MQQRLNKIISAAGVASRRQADQLISQGQVQVNGQTIRELGAKADPERDRIRVKDKLISTEMPKITVMLNKPRGYVSTTDDPEGRPTVLDLVRIKARLYPVGRLDYDSSGLILLTNDGELANLVTHPSSMVPKTYEVKVKGAPSSAVLQKLRKGISLPQRPSAPAQVQVLETAGAHHTWLRITLVEGRNRQVRRMCRSVGHPVLKLKRVAIGSIHIGDLPLAKYRYLEPAEIKSLNNKTKYAKTNKR